MTTNQEGELDFDNLRDEIRSRLPPEFFVRVEENQKIQSAIDALYQLYETLRLDFVEISERKRGGDLDQLTRRELYRAFFAWTEGTISGMKRLSYLAQWGDIGVTYTPQEILILLEEEPNVRKNGAVKTRKIYLETVGNLRFAFRSLAKAYASSFQVDTDGQGFEKFQASLAVRNRITHPKDASDLSISDEEIADLVIALEWFGSAFSELIRDIKTIVTSRLEQYRIDTKKRLDDMANSIINRLMQLAELEQASTQIDEALQNDLDNEAKTLLLDSKSKIDSVTKELRESVSELSPDLAAVFDTLH